jgi:hypothetical protein
MPGCRVNVGVRENPSKYKDLHQETKRFPTLELPIRARKSATGHNVSGNSLNAQ